MAITWTRPPDTATVAVASVGAFAPMAAARAVSPEAAAALTHHRAQAGSLLVQLYQYLEANAEQHPTLADSIAGLASAVAEYRSGLAVDPYSGVRGVLDTIEAARRGDRSIPEP